MKHKSHREIPDYSHKRPGTVPQDAGEQKAAPPPRQPVRPKPQATNAKSGRRGQ